MVSVFAYVDSDNEEETEVLADGQRFPTSNSTSNSTSTSTSTSNSNSNSNLDGEGLA